MKLEDYLSYRKDWVQRKMSSDAFVLISNVYIDDLKKRICRHCKFYGAEHEHISHPNYRTCINRESFTYMIEPHFEDGCNKWEQK